MNAGVSDRLAFRPDDFFGRDIPKADVVLMGHILPGRNLPIKRRLIGKALEAVPVGGALVACEAIIDHDESRNVFGLMSLNTLIETKGGSDCTGSCCSAWMKEAGFATTRAERLVGPDSMLIAIK